MKPSFCADTHGGLHGSHQKLKLPQLRQQQSLIMGQRSDSGSPTGSPVAIKTMLDFASRHQIIPQTEHFPMSQINEAFARLDTGKARYRIVLDADF